MLELKCRRFDQLPSSGQCEKLFFFPRIQLFALGFPLPHLHFHDCSSASLALIPPIPAKAQLSVFISCAQLSVFIYYAVWKPQKQWMTLEEGIWNSPLTYQPDRREEAWRFLSYMFVHAG